MLTASIVQNKNNEKFSGQFLTKHAYKPRYKYITSLISIGLGTVN